MKEKRKQRLKLKIDNPVNEVLGITYDDVSANMNGWRTESQTSDLKSHRNGYLAMAAIAIYVYYLWSGTGANILTLLCLANIVVLLGGAIMIQRDINRSRVESVTGYVSVRENEETGNIYIDIGDQSFLIDGLMAFRSEKCQDLLDAFESNTLYTVFYSNGHIFSVVVHVDDS